MTEQLALTLSAASIGFVSAIFFCIGNALNTPAKIFAQCGTYWDFSAPVARALTAQRAQYVTGALLLVASFVLQVVAALASSTTPASLPQWLHTWPYLVLSVLIPTGIIAAGLSALFYTTTIREVLRLAEVRRQEEETEAKKHRGS